MESLTMERQESLGLSIPSSVVVVGCGGVGAWVAYLLAMAGVPDLWLFDGDNVSLNNLNRLPFPQKDVGKNKALTTAALIKSVRLDCHVVALNQHFIPEVANSIGLLEDSDWVIVATDTVASRRMIKKWANTSSKIKYLEVAAEGEIGSVTGEPATFSTPEETHPGYMSVPVHCIPCVLAASIAVNHVIHNKEMGNRTIRLGWGNHGFEFLDHEE